MTYKSFIGRSLDKITAKKVFLFEGGSEAVRADCLHLLFKRAKEQMRKEGLRDIRCKTFHLSDVADSPLSILSDSVYDMIVLRWEGGLLNEKETKQLMRGFRDASGWGVIADGSGETVKPFIEIFKKWFAAVHVECRKIAWASKDKEELIESRMLAIPLLCNTEVKSYLATREAFWSSQFFNTFRILEALKGDEGLQKEVTKETLRMYGLMLPNVEESLMRVLFDKGKLAFLSVPKLRYNERKLLRYIMRELVLLLMCKTVKGMTDQRRAMSVGIPYLLYLDYKKRAEKLDISLLYRRLYSCMLTLKYRDMPGSIVMLLTTW